jgi:hypothetical protein
MRDAKNSKDYIPTANTSGDSTRDMTQKSYKPVGPGEGELRSILLGEDDSLESELASGWQESPVCAITIDFRGSCES